MVKGLGSRVGFMVGLKVTALRFRVESLGSRK